MSAKSLTSSPPPSPPPSPPSAPTRARATSRATPVAASLPDFDRDHPARTRRHSTADRLTDDPAIDPVSEDGYAAIYAAIGDSAAWDALAEKIARAFQADHAFFLVRASGVGQPAARLIGASSSPTQVAAAYLREVRGFEQQCTSPSGRPAPFLAFPYREQLSKFQFEQGQPARKRRHCLFCLPGFERDGLFILVRPLAPCAFTNAELTLLRRLLPHLSRALRLHHRMMRLADEKSWLEQAVESLPQGLALMDDEGQLLFANKKARAIFSEKAGLTHSNGQLQASSGRDSKDLKQTLARAAARTESVAPQNASNRVIQNQGFQHWGNADRDNLDCIALVPNHSNTCLSLAVSSLPPGPQADGGPARTCPVIRLLIRDSRDFRPPSQESLRRVFDLTPTEAAVARLLGRGLGAEEVAKKRNITRETARFYIKAILQKTDCNRQPQLVHKLAALGF